MAEPRELTAQEAAKSPLFKKLKSLDDFKLDENALDQVIGQGDEALIAQLKQRLGVKG